MKYEGKIKELKQIIVSDPSYHKDVWCRYENDKVNMKNCNIELNIAEIQETIPADEVAEDMSDTLKSQVKDDLTIEGIEFQMLISDGVPYCNLTRNGFTHSHWVKLNDYTIGMDTACVSLGINEVAEQIRNDIKSWQPVTALHTLTDGEFGNVFEGTTPKSKATCLIYISGYLDKDAGYSVEDILDYLKNNFQIDDLHPVEDFEQTNDELEIGGI